MPLYDLSSIDLATLASQDMLSPNLATYLFMDSEQFSMFVNTRQNTCIINVIEKGLQIHFELR